MKQFLVAVAFCLCATAAEANGFEFLQNVKAWAKKALKPNVTGPLGLTAEPGKEQSQVIVGLSGRLRNINYVTQFPANWRDGLVDGKDYDPPDYEVALKEDVRDKEIVGSEIDGEYYASLESHVSDGWIRHLLNKESGCATHPVYNAVKFIKPRFQGVFTIQLKFLAEGVATEYIPLFILDVRGPNQCSLYTAGGAAGTLQISPVFVVPSKKIRVRFRILQSKSVSGGVLQAVSTIFKGQTLESDKQTIEQALGGSGLATDGMVSSLAGRASLVVYSPFTSLFKSTARQTFDEQIKSILSGDGEIEQPFLTDFDLNIENSRGFYIRSGVGPYVSELGWRAATVGVIVRPRISVFTDKTQKIGDILVPDYSRVALDSKVFFDPISNQTKNVDQIIAENPVLAQVINGFNTATKSEFQDACGAIFASFRGLQTPINVYDAWFIVSRLYRRTALGRANERLALRPCGTSTVPAYISQFENLSPTLTEPEINAALNNISIHLINNFEAFAGKQDKSDLKGFLESILAEESILMDAGRAIASDFGAEKDKSKIVEALLKVRPASKTCRFTPAQERQSVRRYFVTTAENGTPLLISLGVIDALSLTSPAPEIRKRVSHVNVAGLSANAQKELFRELVNASNLSDGERNQCLSFI